MAGTFNLEEVRSGASDGLVGVLTNRKLISRYGREGTYEVDDEGAELLKDV